MKRITNKCGYCGSKMYPQMEYEKYGDDPPFFFFKCPNCKATSPRTMFDRTMINDNELVVLINETLEEDFDLEDDENETSEYGSKDNRSDQ